MLSGIVLPSEEGPLTNLAIGKGSSAGNFRTDSFGGGTAVGYGASANDYSTVLGCAAFADSIEGIAIGHMANVTGGSGISIGAEVVGNGIGIKGSVTGSGIGIGGDATGNGIAIGGSVEGDGIGIRGSVADGGIGIGGNATGGGIGIGGNATGANIQLGNNGLKYDLTVGSGTGTLKIGSIAGIPKIESIKFNKMTIVSQEVEIPKSGVYLCCTTYKPNPQLTDYTSHVAICFINDINQSASILTTKSGSVDSCSYDNIAHKIKPGTNFTIQYCFKIISL